MQRNSLVASCGLVALAVTCLYLVSWGAARGGIHYFSPYTLETQAHHEILLPFSEIPIYRSSAHTYRHELVQYLIDQDYWTPTAPRSPPFVSSRWNRQWKDGQTEIHRHLSRHGDTWIEWTEEHPDIAARLWPQVLRLLRSDSQHSRNYAELLLWHARGTTTMAEYNQCIAADKELAAAMRVVKPL